MRTLLVLAALAGFGLACAYESDCADRVDNDEDGRRDCRDADCDADPACSDGEDDCTPEASCCAVCSTGRACGDACISASSTCETLGGCACNESEVCR